MEAGRSRPPPGLLLPVPFALLRLDAFPAPEAGLKVTPHPGHQAGFILRLNIPLNSQKLGIPFRGEN